MTERDYIEIQEKVRAKLAEIAKKVNDSAEKKAVLPEDRKFQIMLEIFRRMQAGSYDKH